MGQMHPEINFDTLRESGRSTYEDCPVDVNMEYKQGNSTEISFQKRWEREFFINAVEDCFTRIEDALISYNG